MNQLAITLILSTCAALFLLLTPASEAFYQRSDCCCNRTHNFFYGRKSPYDKLLFSNHTYAPARPYGKNSVLLTLPRMPVYPRPRITYVEVLDSYSDGLGACAKLRNGGVGYAYVTLNLTSSVNHPINSLVNVYGHY